jgi:hypothetical protein
MLTQTDPAYRDGSDATKALQARQTKQMIWLTVAIAALTMVMAIGVAVQIYLTIHPPH